MLFPRIARYFIVGGFCSLAFIMSANLIFYFSSQEWFATLVSNAIGILCGYFLQMRVTFQAQGEYIRRFSKYLILSCLIFLYSQGVVFCFNYEGISYIFTSFFIALSIPLFSYPLQKFWVFGERK